MLLRPYQEEAIKKMEESVALGDTNGLLCLPTGGGKTITACEWLDRRFLSSGGTVLWLAHRKELLDQAEETFKRVCPNRKLTRWNADEKDATGQIVLASIFSARALKGTWNAVVLDEAHHGAMPSFMNKIEREDIQYKFLLGLTATPIRLDKKELPYDRILYQISMLELAQQGYLAIPRYIRLRTNQKYQMRMQAGDFSGSSLRRLDNDTRNEIIVNEYLSHKKEYGPSLLFAVNVEHAETIYTLLLKKGVRAAVAHAGTPASERERIVADINAGDLDVVVNVQLFTEGIDIPRIRTVILGRPTASKVLWNQMVGRGTRTDRPCPQCKEQVTKELTCPNCGTVKEQPTWKKEFTILDIVDDVDKYETLATEWALEEVGKDNLPQDIQDELLDEELLGRLLSASEEAGITIRPEDLERQIIEAYAILVWSNKYKSGKMIINREQLCSLRKMVLLSANEDIRNNIEGWYGLACQNASFGFREWKNICWAYWAYINDVNKDPKYYRLVTLKPEEKSTQALLDEIRNAQQLIDARQKNMTDTYLQDVVKGAREQLVERPELAAAIKQVSARGSVLTVTCDATYEDIGWDGYQEITQAIQNATDLDVGVKLVLKEARLAATAYTDGSANNAGDRNGGWAFVLYQEGKSANVQWGRQHHTSSAKMELLAAIKAIEAAELDSSTFMKIYSDSEYVVNGAKWWIKNWRKSNWTNKEGRKIANLALWKRLDALLKKKRVQFEHVKGHNQNAHNEYCDRLANMARKGEI